MNGWSMSHEFKELKRELPSLAPEDVDCYFTAFIEGEQGLSEGELRRSEHLLEKMRDEAPGNLGANAWGPIYWAYRRCYKGTIIWLILYTAFIYQGMFFGVSIFTFLPVLANGALFNYAYRMKAFKELKRAISSGVVDRERIVAHMRHAGGTDSAAAYKAALAWGLLFALGVALFVLFFPERFFR